MEKDRDIQKDLEKSYGDYAHSGIKAGLSTFPCIGGSIAEFFSIVVSPPLEKRRNEWIIEIYDRLVLLEKRIEGFNIESLSKNENFISTLLYATQVAMRTHKKEKLKALKNAVINSAFKPEIDESMQMIFLNIIDRYTPWHLIILDFLNDPDKYEEYREIMYPKYSSESMSTALEYKFHELRGKKELYTQIAKDLASDGLIRTADIHITMDGIGNFPFYSTNIGNEFLKFINFDLKKLD